MPKSYKLDWSEEAGWHISFSIEGRRIRRRLGIRERRFQALARKAADRRFKDEWERHLAPASEPGVTFAEAAAGYVRAGGEARFLKPIMLHFGPDTTIDEIGEVGIAAAGKALYPHAAPDTVRRQVRVPVRAVLRWARGERRQRGTDTARVRWLTPEEAERLIACAGRIAPLVAFLLGTGVRTGEAFGLGRANMNPATRQAFIDDPKNGYSRWVSYPEKTTELLGALPDVGAVFLTPKGLPYKLRVSGGGQMKGAFDKARELAGLGPDVTPHVCRHSWATWFYAQTRDFGALMDLGGWRKADMANRYRKLAPDDLADRLRAFGWDFGREFANSAGGSRNIKVVQ